MLEACLEQAIAIIFSRSLRVAPGGRLEQFRSSLKLAAVAEERLEPGVGRCGRSLAPVRRGHRLAQRHRFVDEPFVPERTLQPEESHAEPRIQLERLPGLGDRLVVASGPVQRSRQVRVARSRTEGRAHGPARVLQSLRRAGRAATGSRHASFGPSASLGFSSSPRRNSRSAPAQSQSYQVCAVARA